MNDRWRRCARSSERRRADDVRPRKRGGEQQQRRDTGREQKQIAQATSSRTRNRRSTQQPDGAERHFGRDVAPQEMQHDRHRDSPGRRAEMPDRESSSAPTSVASARRQVRQQRKVERLRCIELHVVDARAAKLAVVAKRQARELTQVAGADGRGIGGHFVARSRDRGNATRRGTGTSARADRAPGTRRRPCRGTSDVEAP